MTGAQALDILMGRLGKRNLASLRATALLEMNLVQSVELEKGHILPWFLITESASVTLTVDERRIPVPEDFLEELDEDGGLVILDEEGKEHVLEKGSYDLLLGEYGSDATSDLPLKYALIGDYFMTFPITTEARTIRMRYYASQDPIEDGDTENAWLKHAPDLLIAKTGMIMGSTHIQLPPDTLTAFNSQEVKALARLLAQTTSRAEANRSRNMGEPS